MFVAGACSSLKKTDNDNSTSNKKTDEAGQFVIMAPHEIEKIFYVDNFHLVKKTQTKMMFETFCPVSNSSWKVMVDLTTSNMFDDFHLLVTLLRTDSGLIPIEGHVLVWFLNADGKTCPVSYRVSKTIPYKVGGSKYNLFMDISRSVQEKHLVNQHFRCLTNKGNKDCYLALPNDLLILKVQLFIRGCCDCNEKVGSSLYSADEDTSRMLVGDGDLSNTFLEDEILHKICLRDEDKINISYRSKL